MIAKKKPYKPSSPLGVISFPQKGAVKKIVEHLPKEKDKLEYAVVSKFFDNLPDRAFSELEQNQENDLDFICVEMVDENTVKWEIELTEFFIKDWRMLDISRQSYFMEIIKVFGEKEWIRNHSILLSDNYTPFPNVNKDAGKALLKLIIETIDSLEDEYKETEDGILRVKKIGNDCSIHFIKNPAIRKGLGFYEGYIGSPDGFNQVVINTIGKKINKNYNKPNGIKCMLLCYSTQNIFQFDDTLKALIETMNNNQFDEVWYTHPLPMERASLNTRII